MPVILPVLVVALVLVIIAFRAWSRPVANLLSDDMIQQLAAQLPELKKRALALVDVRPEALQSELMVLSYSICRNEGRWVHHLSFSNAVTPARAAGTFYLGLVRGYLGLTVPAEDVFVTQRHVFHLILILSDEQQEAFIEREPGPLDPATLRALAVSSRDDLLRQLRQVEIELPDRSAGG